MRKKKFNFYPGLKAPFPFTLEDIVCGVDEAGRGPLAGPVYAAAVILNPDHPIEGLRDSKKLTAERREELAPQIKAHALAWAIAECSHEEIDRYNILQATMMAMCRAVTALATAPTVALIDGNPHHGAALPCDRRGRRQGACDIGGLDPGQDRARRCTGGAARAVSAVWLRPAQGLWHRAAPGAPARAWGMSGAPALLRTGKGVFA
jgi:hypothetical protein